jgi:polyisoprenoid-binding protein YceI
MLFLIFTLLFNSWDSPASREVVINIQNKSLLSIHGESNVNSFTFKYDPQYLQKSVCMTVETSSNRMSLREAILDLKVKGFDSGNRLMNSDLYELLNAQNFPHITIDFKSVIPKLQNNPHNTLVVSAKVTMAGQTHDEIFEVQPKNDSKEYHYTGKTRLNLKNYCITPPTKFMGMVKVKEELTINFNLHFKLEEI